MLTLYAPVAGALAPVEHANLRAPEVVWCDLEAPTDAEERTVEAALGLDVPTHQERMAAEESARFYRDGDALVLSPTLLGRREEGAFMADPVTFILSQGKLVTIRRIRPRAFEAGSGRASARIGSARSGGAVFVALITSAVERLADMIADLRGQALAVARDAFDESAAPIDLGATLRLLGRLGVQASIAHDCLSSLNRMMAFAGESCAKHDVSGEDLAALARDVNELERGAEALQDHLTFLQNAAIGMVNAAQNNVLKVVALATMAFVPPTLVASIFGMNFKAMHWFDAPWGPWAGFALMALAPLALFAWARWRKWF
ncbi:MAG: hypothetical protein GC189_12665 [Alphaproteobacteria bacterium]|nr:hypothetical protein [Alphaproteobacteria bacterium]